MPGWASALGLGELRGQIYLGQGLSVEVPIIGGEKTNLDAGCFRLVQPSAAGDLPWLKKATLSVRKGGVPVLVIRSEAPVREPIVQVAVELGCGHEISREYVLLASPAQERAPAVQERPAAGESLSSIPLQRNSRSERLRPEAKPINPVLRPAAPVPSAPRMAANPLHDRVMLSNDAGFDEISLRFSTDLSVSGTEAVREEQREILRLEFRMLQAMHDQATSQLATAEKLRNMEATLGELQKHAATFSERIDAGAAAPGEASATIASAQPHVPVPPSGNMPDSSGTKNSAQWLSEWTLYGLLAGALLGLAGWLGWREYRERRQILAREEELFSQSVPDVDPKRADEFDDVDFPLGVSPEEMSMPVDVELDAADEKPAGSSMPGVKKTPLGHDSIMSIGSATTVDEHFEANPVMELADIMLSFGRVKGAAQALQEYIDNNPQEALQPWIRLMDVYRMAGMRSEFESVAHNLNQHFNVEVQSWDDAPLLPEAPSGEASSDEAHALELVPVETMRPGSIEDMPRLMNAIIEQWSSGDVVGYLYQLLRDNRGGKRAGFALQVVEDILFLIELKETSSRMEKEA